MTLAHPPLRAVFHPEEKTFTSPLTAHPPSKKLIGTLVRELINNNN
jgi:hypothetical protein